jgi:transporter family-2 protein
MTSDTVRFALWMLLAGCGIPVLAALNAQLGSRIGSAPVAATVLFVVAFTATLLVATVTTGLAPLSLLALQPTYLFAGGLFIAFYVLSITWVAPRFGIGNAIMCVLFGQMIAATAIDHFGLFGAIVKPLSATRGGGLALMATGLVLFQWR